MIQDVKVNDAVTTVPPTLKSDPVCVKLTGPQTGHVLLSPTSEELSLAISELEISVSEASEVTIFFGDGSGSLDKFRTHYLAAGVPYTMPGPHNVKPPIGGPGDDLKITTSAGNVYVNAVCVQAIVQE